jgi:stage IV sporulation protein A
MTELRVHLPRWLDALEEEHPVKAALYQALLRCSGEIRYLSQAEETLQSLQQLEQVQDYTLRGVSLSEGYVSCAIVLPEQLYYEILSTKAGLTIENDAQLLSLLMELAKVKQEYDKISDALTAVKATGYGVVQPSAEEMKLEKPEIIRKGSTFGVKLKAGAPSIHMVRVDLDTEISPMVGDEKQSRDLIEHLTGEDPEHLWQSNIFGKSVYDLIQEGLTAKLVRMPTEVRGKFRGTLTRIVNEGATGLICLIL